jgi:hypothetical protein
VVPLKLLSRNLPVETLGSFNHASCCTLNTSLESQCCIKPVVDHFKDVVMDTVRYRELESCTVLIQSVTISAFHK